MIIQEAQQHREQVIALLAAEKLPVTDLPEELANFIVAIQDGILIGVAGIEIYGDNGLLRSLAVSPGNRGAGIADKLLARLDAMGKEQALTALYLLTETAPAYFERKGYLKITREDIPVGVQQSSQFSYVCPVSAIAMKKIL